MHIVVVLTNAANGRTIITLQNIYMLLFNSNTLSSIFLYLPFCFFLLFLFSSLLWMPGPSFLPFSNVFTICIFVSSFLMFSVLYKKSKQKRYGSSNTMPCSLQYSEMWGCSFKPRHSCQRKHQKGNKGYVK